MKWVNSKLLYEAGWYNHVVGAVFPSYCVKCESQMSHVVVAKGVFDRVRMVKLCCLNCDKEVD